MKQYETFLPKLAFTRPVRCTEQSKVNTDKDSLLDGFIYYLHFTLSGVKVDNKVP